MEFEGWLSHLTRIETSASQEDIRSFLEYCVSTKSRFRMFLKQDPTIGQPGPIGCGEKLMKDAKRRDELRDTCNVIGLEMEAAATVNRIPVG